MALELAARRSFSWRKERPSKLPLDVTPQVHAEPNKGPPKGDSSIKCLGVGGFLGSSVGECHKCLRTNLLARRARPAADLLGAAAEVPLPVGPSNGSGCVACGLGSRPRGGVKNAAAGFATCNKKLTAPQRCAKVGFEQLGGGTKRRRNCTPPHLNELPKGGSVF